jgi:hypothetical protein
MSHAREVTAWEPHMACNCDLGVGISTVLEIIGHFLFKGGWDHHVQSWLTYHQMFDTRNKNIRGTLFKFIEYKPITF